MIIMNLLSIINAIVFSDEISIETILSVFQCMINVGTFIESTSGRKAAIALIIEKQCYELNTWSRSKFLKYHKLEL